MVEPRIAYLAEGNRQHAFPVEALLAVRDAPVFSNGKALAESLRKSAKVHVHAPGELSAALLAQRIDVVLSTSQLLSPDLLRAHHPRLRCVFVGHGESDKTHDCKLQERFVHNPINEQFDLLLLASHAHLATQKNPNKLLVGHLKHDLFVARKYHESAPSSPRVLWAPGWGRHNAARWFSGRVSEATARLGIPLDIHLHPHSYSAEPDVTRLVQLEMLRHEHVRVIQSADILGAMSRASLMIGDVSSVCYDWLLFDRPLVFLDHPGLSVPEEKLLFEVGKVAAPYDDLSEVLERELAEPGRHSALRRATLDERFFCLDGRAARRAIEAVLERASRDWGLSC